MGNPQGMTSRVLELKYMILYSIKSVLYYINTSILPSGWPVLKTNYILNFNNFLNTRSILDLKVSLDSACQHLTYNFV